MTHGGTEVVNNGSLSFGNALANGNTIGKDLVLTNTGTATLNLTGWPIFMQPGTVPNGPLPFRFEGVLPTSLAPGVSATVRVVYAPTAVGDHAATLQISNSDFDEGIYKINVSGHADVNPNQADIALSLNGADLPQNAVVDFGTVARGVTVTKEILVKNEGTGNLNMLGYSFQPPTTTGVTTSAFFISGTPAATLAPGASGTLRLSFRPTATGSTSNSVINITSTDLDETPYKLTLIGASTLTDSEIGVSLGGVDVPNNGSVSFGNTTAGATAIVRDIVIANTGDAALSLTGWSILPATGTTFPATGSPFRFEGQLPNSVAPAATVTVRVAYIPLGAGDHSAIVQIANSDLDEGLFKIQVSGHADASLTPPDIALTSGNADLPQNATIDFGAVGRGFTVTKDITVKNTGSGTLNLSSYTFVNQLPAGVTSSAFFVSGYPSNTLAPGASGTLRLSFKPSALSSSYRSVLSIISSDPDESPYTLTLTGTSLATDGEIGVTVSGVDAPNNSPLAYGSAAVGASITKTLTIANTGNGPLSLSNWMITASGSSTAPGPGPFRFSGPFPATVPAGATATISVAYAPWSVGAASFVLQFTSSDFDEGTYRLTLTGTALPSTTPPEIGVSVGGVDLPNNSDLDFGASPLGVSVPKDVVISNSGTGPLVIAATYLTAVQPTPNSTANMPAHSIAASPPLSIPAGGTGVVKLNFK
ncbi:MAG: choice-of-anchor D domain-containing protein, partial [Roseimicrobium sp.]